MIVGLLAELEYRSGAVLPAKKRVIEMPLAVNDTPRPRPAVPAAVVGIRLEDGKQSRIPKLALAGVALGIVGCVLAINLYHGGENASRVFYTPVAMENLGFNASDDCHTVLETLGPPARDLRQSDAQGREFRLLWYPRHRVQIVLMGQGGAEARYIGALGRYGRPVHSVAIPGFGDSYRLLAALR